MKNLIWTLPILFVLFPSSLVFAEIQAPQAPGGSTNAQKANVPSLIKDLGDQRKPLSERIATAQQIQELLKSPANRQAHIEKDLGTLSQSHDPDSQRLAINLLGEIPTPEAQASIANVFKDRRNRDLVRGSALSLYAHSLQGASRVIKPEVKRALTPLLQDPEPFVAVRAARTLVALGDTSGGVILEKAANLVPTDQNRLAKTEALRALGELGDPRYTNLLKTETQSQDLVTRGEALIALKDLEYRQLTDPALQLDYLKNTLGDGRWGPHRQWAFAQLALILEDATSPQFPTVFQILKSSAQDSKHAHHSFVKEFFERRCAAQKGSIYCL